LLLAFGQKRHLLKNKTANQNLYSDQRINIKIGEIVNWINNLKGENEPILPLINSLNKIEVTQVNAETIDGIITDICEFKKQPPNCTFEAWKKARGIKSSLQTILTFSSFTSWEQIPAAE